MSTEEITMKLNYNLYIIAYYKKKFLLFYFSFIFYIYFNFIFTFLFWI